MCSRLSADTISLDRPGNGGAPPPSGLAATAKGVAMRARLLLQVGGVLGAAALTLGAVAPVSHADRTAVSLSEEVFGFGYDNIITGVDPSDPLVLYAGVSLDQWCDPDGGTAATVRQRAKGDTAIARTVARFPLWVYDAGGLPFPEFADQYCEGAITDPEPVAVGTGTFRFQVKFTDSAPPLVTNTVNGSVRTADGDTWAVNGYAEIVFDPGPETQEMSFTIRNQR